MNNTEREKTDLVVVIPDRNLRGTQSGVNLVQNALRTSIHVTLHKNVYGLEIICLVPDSKDAAEEVRNSLTKAGIAAVVYKDNDRHIREIYALPADLLRKLTIELLKDGVAEPAWDILREELVKSANSQDVLNAVEFFTDGRYYLPENFE